MNQDDGMTLNKKAWYRYMARSIDMLIGALFIGFIVGVFLTILMIVLSNFMEVPEDILATIPDFLLGVIIVFFYLIVEATMFSAFKTSLGKKIFGITITDKHNNSIEFTTALKRNFLLWFRGMALSIPFLSILTLINAHGSYTNNGITTWDEDMEVLVQFKKISTVRVAFGIVLFVLVMALNFMFIASI